MKIVKDHRLVTTAAELRRQADELLCAKTAHLHSPRNNEETQKLIHELEVHQIELEMQNAELRQARDVIDSALESYTDLFDFAPFGYFTLNRNGAISAVNLSGANLLGIERAKLLDRSLALFIEVNTRPLFSDFLDKVFASHGKLCCEVSLTTKDNSQLFVRVMAATSSSREECRVALIDVTERKRDEKQIQRYIEDLRSTNEELARFNNASVGRELHMIELKKEVNALYIQVGRPQRYPLDFEKE